MSGCPASPFEMGALGVSDYPDQSVFLTGRAFCKRRVVHGLLFLHLLTTVLTSVIICWHIVILYYFDSRI